MSFPTNTSPYGMTNQFQASQSPQSQNTNSGWFQALFGKPERNYQQSLLGQEQQPGYRQLLAAGQGPGAGGAFGEAADYYRNLLSNNSADFDAFAAPEMRRYNEQTIPGLAEQFAGMGSGGLSSSGFRNAATSAGADLGERLGAIRAQLRQQGSQGLQQIGQAGLGQFNENINRPETFGLAGSLAEGLGKGIGSAGGMFLGNKFR